jgi:hypothetical protein
LPIVVFLILAMAACLVLFSMRWPTRVPAPRWPWVALSAMHLLLIPIYQVAGGGGVVLGGLLGGAGAAWRLGWLRNLTGWLRSWVTGMPTRFRERDKQTWTVGLVFWRLTLGGGMFIFGVVLLVSAVRLIALLFSPLPG